MVEGIVESHQDTLELRWLQASLVLQALELHCCIVQVNFTVACVEGSL